jgi:hypothetical protein
MVTQSQASKIRRALIKTDRLSERQNQGNLVTQSHGSKVTAGIVTRIARLPLPRLEPRQKNRQDYPRAHELKDK